MLWNTFESVRDRLNLYDNPHFEKDSGITDREELIEGIEALANSMRGEEHPIIKARAIAYVLDNAAIEVNPIDWFGLNFCGWMTQAQMNLLGGDLGLCRPTNVLSRRWLSELTPPKEFEEAAKGIWETGAGLFYPDYDHSVPDWDSVIGLGFGGLLARARGFYDEKLRSGEMSEAQEVYYQAIFIVYEALLRILERFLACAKKHIGDDDKMPIMVECLETLAHGNAQTLYQYLMMTYLYHLFQEQLDVIQVRTLGNLDVDGYPFYQEDVAKGRLTAENAEELFRFFFEKYANQGNVYAQPLYFGGFDENGNSLINELSHIMLTGYDKSCIVSPKLFVKVMPNTPDDFLKQALDMVRRGRNSIVFINEELGCRISRKLGRSEEETRRLVGTGCNNFASRGRETTPEHMYVNLAKGVELVFNRGRDPLTGDVLGVDTGDVTELDTFDAFRAAYIKQVECLINKAFVISDFYDENLLTINPAPMYSATMPDSVACGRDAYHNGVKYNNTVMFLSCHATVADSLMMVKKHVYDQKNVTVAELRDALLANWEGHEELRELLRSDPEKYGNNIDTVDMLLCDLLDYFTTYVTSRKNKRGGHFVVNGESIWLAHKWAPLCGATPDGRARGDLLSKNMSASIGQDRQGITAHILSATKIDATNFAYGCPFDYMLHPTAVKGEHGLDVMLGLLRAFMKRGGYGFQGNVHGSETLKDAQVHPENHAGLQVRIGGWSWFFTRMDKEYQDEFIHRAELEEQAR